MALRVEPLFVAGCTPARPSPSRFVKVGIMLPTYEGKAVRAAGENTSNETRENADRAADTLSSDGGGAGMRFGGAGADDSLGDSDGDGDAADGELLYVECHGAG